MRLPILKLTAIFSLASGALLHLAHASKHVHESVLLRSLWDCLLALRLISYQVSTPGFRTRQVILVTTLLDHDLHPASDLAALYFQRWSIELHFREIKTLLGMDVLRCKSPQMVLKEVLMHQIAYNMVRALMQEAALRYHLDLSRLSFKATLDSIAHFSNAIHPADGKPRKQRALLGHSH